MPYFPFKSVNKWVEDEKISVYLNTVIPQRINECSPFIYLVSLRSRTNAEALSSGSPDRLLSLACVCVHCLTWKETMRDVSGFSVDIEQCLLIDIFIIIENIDKDDKHCHVGFSPSTRSSRLATCDMKNVDELMMSLVRSTSPMTKLAATRHRAKTSARSMLHLVCDKSSLEAGLSHVCRLI
jgi:hypothetical protein